MTNSLRKKKVGYIEEPLEFEEFMQLKFGKRPFNPHRLNGVIVPSNWLMVDDGHWFHKVFSTAQIERFRQKVERDFSFMMEKPNPVKTAHLPCPKSSIRQTIIFKREETYTLVEKAVRKATKYALQNQPPPIMSPSLRVISLNILELLADLYNIDIPSRSATDKHSQFLIYIADWSAKIICHVYCKILPDDGDDDYCAHSPSSKLSVAEVTNINNSMSLDELFSQATQTSTSSSNRSVETDSSKDTYSANEFGRYITTESKQIRKDTVDISKQRYVHNCCELYWPELVCEENRMKEQYLKKSSKNVKEVDVKTR